MTEVARLQYRLEASTARFERSIKRAERQMNRSARGMERRVTSLDSRMAKFGSRFGIALPAKAAASAAAIAGIGIAIRGVVKAGDQVTKVEGRFKALTGSAERADKLLQGVFGTIQKTGGAFDATAGAVSRFRIAADAIEATDEEVLRLNESVQKLGVIGGSSAQEISSGAVQLGQALASGRLQGDELRSIMENLPLVAKALADGLGVSVGELRKMGSEGRLVSKEVFGAILSQTEEIDRKFEDIPSTVERASGRLKGALTQVLAGINENVGASRTWAGVLDGITAQLKAAGESQRELAAAAAPVTIPESEGSITGAQAQMMNAARRQGRAIGPDGKPTSTGLDFMDPRSGPAEGGVYRGNADFDEGEIAAAAARRLNARLSSGERYPPAPPTPYLEALPGARGEPVTSSPAPLSRPSRSSGGGGSGRSAAIEAEISAYDQLTESIMERMRASEQELSVIGKSAFASDRARAGFEAERLERRLLEAAQKDGITVTSEVQAQIDETVGKYRRLEMAIIDTAAAHDRQAEAIRRTSEASEKAKRDLAQISDRLIGAVQSADSFSSALLNVGLQLLNLGVQGALGQGPAASLFATAGGQGVLGQGPPAGPSPPQISGLYAKGGVFSAPTTFPMAGGSIGMLGEAGPEAIMPLKRGRGGRLGVEAGGGGGGSRAPVFNIDARGATDPAATAAQLRRAMQETIKQVPSIIEARERSKGRR